MPAIFADLRPACRSLAKSPSLENVGRLQQLLLSLPDHQRSLTDLQEYILFPLELVLKRTSQKEQIVVAVLQCIQQLLLRSVTTNKSLALSHFCRLASWMSLEKLSESSVSPSEELRLAAVTCCQQLIFSCSHQLLKQLFSISCRPQLGYLVFQLTAIVRHDRLRSLRLAALDCVRSLAFSDHPSSEIVEASSAVFAAFLPGILSAVFSVISGDVKQGFQVISKSVDVWNSLTVHVLRDDLIDKQSSTDNKQSSTPQTSADTNSCNITAPIRDQRWLQLTLSRVRPMLAQMLSLCLHNHRQVRLSLCQLCRQIITHCRSSLSSCMSNILEILAMLTCDDLDEVSESAREVIDLGRCGDTADDSAAVMAVIESDLFSLLRRLPTIITGHSYEKSLIHLSLLEGYLRAVGADLKPLLMCSWRVELLISCLLQLVEMTADGGGGIHQLCASDNGRSILCDGDTAAFVARMWQLRFCDDAALWRRVCNCCRLLGCHGNVSLLLSALQDGGVCRSDEHRLLWNQILLGQEACFLAVERVGGCAWQLARDIDIQCLVDEITSPSSSSPSLSRRRCLALQSVAHVARVVGGGSGGCLPALFLLSLAPVLECAGCDCDAAVTLSARATLHCLASALPNNTLGVSGMVRRYLHRLSVHMRRQLLACVPAAGPAAGVKTARACWMMCALLPHIGSADLPHIEDATVALLSCLDAQYQQHALIIITTLGRLLDSMAQWFMPQPPEGVVIGSACAGDDVEAYSSCGLDRFLQHHQHQLQLFKCLHDDDDDDDSAEQTHEDITSTESRDQEASVPLHVRLTCSICVRCSRMLDVESTAVKVAALDSLSGGLKLLADGGAIYREQLLPLLHSCWPQMARVCTAANKHTAGMRSSAVSWCSHRNKPVSAAVLLHALRCMSVAGRAGGDFLQQRVSHCCLTPLLDWLRRGASDAAVISPPLRRVQLEALQILAGVCSSLRLGLESVQAVVRAVINYLSVKQPQQLQTACIQLLCDLSDYDGDNVWWSLTTSHKQMTELERRLYDSNYGRVMEKVNGPVTTLCPLKNAQKSCLFHGGVINVTSY